MSTKTAKNAKKKAADCLHPECNERAVSRGLCEVHYQQAWRVVKGGLASWEQLERRGLARAMRPVNLFRELAESDDGSGPPSAASTRAGARAP